MKKVTILLAMLFICSSVAGCTLTEDDGLTAIEDENTESINNNSTGNNTTVNSVIDCGNNSTLTNLIVYTDYQDYVVGDTVTGTLIANCTLIGDDYELPYTLTDSNQNTIDSGTFTWTSNSDHWTNTIPWSNLAIGNYCLNAQLWDVTTPSVDYDVYCFTVDNASTNNNGNNNASNNSTDCGNDSNLTNLIVYTDYQNYIVGDTVTGTLIANCTLIGADYELDYTLTDSNQNTLDSGSWTWSSNSNYWMNTVPWSNLAVENYCFDGQLWDVTNTVTAVDSDSYCFTVSDLPPDLDGDGIPDNLDDDDDNDGYPDWCEQNWGTDPQDPNSFPTQGQGCNNHSINCTNNSGGLNIASIALDYSTLQSQNLDISSIGGIEYDCNANLIYAYAWDNFQPEEVFLSINPNTGLISYMGNIPNMRFVNQGESTFNDTNYFALMSDDQQNKYLVHISVAGGYSVSSIALDYSAVPDLGPLGGIEYDNTTGLIYAYAWNDTAQEEVFVSLDPVSGAISYLGTITGMKYVSMGESTFHGTDYFSVMLDDQQNKHLVHISIANGFSVSTILLDYSGDPDLAGLNGIEYDPNTDSIYGISWNDTAQEMVIVLVDPVSGLVSYQGTVHNIQSVNSGISTFDTSNYFTLMSDGQQNGFLVHIIV